MPDFACIGVPYFLGERITGRSEVHEVKTSGIAAEIAAPWLDVEPDFDAESDPVVAVNRALAAVIAAHPGRIPLIFAADCTSALGAVKGLASRAPAILWYDAHGDFNTPETSPSGFLGGMPLAMLVGRGDMSLLDGVGLTPLPESDVILTDARDLDPAERRALRESAVIHLPNFDDLLTHPLPDKPLYIHLDTDVINPAEMPAMSYPAPGGPSVEAVAASLRRVAREGQIAGILFGLWNAEIASDDRPLQGTLRLVRAFVEGLGS
jgi:arginase